MFERPSLLLIIAQSGRMLAQSAAREGYSVRVADCFGDVDTLDVADRFIKLPPMDKTSHSEWLNVIISLSQDQPCSLICGTGIEQFYPALMSLPSHIHFAGSSLTSIQQVCEPINWIALLERLSLPFPPTRLHLPSSFKEKWLAKKRASWGGHHIVNARAVTETTDLYYQQYIAGRCASVLFLAHNRNAHVLLINQQFNVDAELDKFGLQAIASGMVLSDEQQNNIYLALQKLTQHLDLAGLMSLDFLITPSGDIFLLELNPRPTASCQLLPSSFPIIGWQLMCSTGGMPQLNTELPFEKQLLWFCFAPKKITIPANFDWPEYCYDIPATGSIINRGEIICSLLLEQKNDPIVDGHLIANKLIENLSIPA